MHELPLTVPSQSWHGTPGKKGFEERFGESAYLHGAYADMIKERIAAIRDRYGLRSGPVRKVPAQEDEQQWLF